MRALRKVLVVDDDPMVGKSFERVLSEKGCAVSTALNGQEALRKLGEDDYDVVYTDIRMPGMNGIEVAERVKQKRPWIPVVIVTGYGTAANEAKAKEVGVSGFLHKPLSPDMIEASAQEAFRENEAALAPQIRTVAALERAPATAESVSTLRNIALFLAAPFVGLAYVVAAPFVGLAMLARMGATALLNRSGKVTGFLKNIALFFAAPFVALAYVLATPFIGLGMLVWMAARAWLKKTGTE